jgi:anti-sigma B factor antagonist
MDSSLTVEHKESITTKDGSHNIPVMKVIGRLDTNTVAILESHISKAMTKSVRSIIFDMSGLEYVSSSGFRLLLMARREARERKGTVMICGLSQRVRDAFDIVGFTSLFDIHRTVEDAKKALGA